MNDNTNNNNDDPRPSSDAVGSLLESLTGERHPGGCDDCDAYQTVRPDETHMVWRMTVHHDDWCPFYLSLQNRAARRREGKR